MKTRHLREWGNALTEVASAILLLTTLIRELHPSNKISVDGSMEQSLFDLVIHDLNIDGAVILRNKIKVQILHISPVS